MTDQITAEQLLNEGIAFIDRFIDEVKEHKKAFEAGLEALSQTGNHLAPQMQEAIATQILNHLIERSKEL